MASAVEASCVTILEVIPHNEQRYPTVGDWFRDSNGVLRIRSSRLSDWRMEFLIQIHELIEQALCRRDSISETAVDEFDMGAGADLPEPGDSPLAPYHSQHVRAGIVERLLAFWLGVNWEEYEAAIEALP